MSRLTGNVTSGMLISLLLAVSEEACAFSTNNVVKLSRGNVVLSLASENASAGSSRCRDGDVDLIGTTTCSGGRRTFLLHQIAPTLLGSACIAISSSASTCNALDMDAFANSQLAADTPSKDLSDDEALCKFGAPGKDRGDACQRAGIKTSKGNKAAVDAYGRVDRGDFVRCVREWRIVDGKYEKFDTCK